MVIKNSKELAKSQLRANALKIIEAGFAAMDTENVIKNSLKLYQNNLLIVKDTWLDLTKFRRVYLVGIGKAAFSAARAIEEILGDKITDGIVLDINGGLLKRSRSLVGTHPVPSQVNLSATREIISLLKSAAEDDLVVAIISGGGSALLCSPYKLSCEKKESVVGELIKNGANIEEINTVRKHLSEIKGGNFARLAYPASLVALIFSDVPGDDISVVASGPTVLDTTTVADASKIMAKYDVLKKCKLPHCDLIETPKDPTYFQLVINIVVANNQLALLGMAKKAKELKYKVEVFSSRLEGEATAVGKKLVLNAKPKTALLAAGETTVKVAGAGWGGRNQHLVLSALAQIQKSQVIISVDSDGIDHSRFAGALGDQATLTKAKRKKLEVSSFLETCDSFHFFQKVGDGIETGILGSNIADFMLVLAK
ncbi:MAG: hypothetical protein A2126_02065 [Candidatus Woykebacteria bacterium GWB1_45_5]|uniref:Glycerate kinase n=2 Tax=Candidatus Woykeibacteriota TaxID=1817899 RepID=A0A1G1W492_9BACT|nr:MAG: hypothetical protein A2113_01800 [Candidatus Woykebacteria bacterium GWA1_44_8]OGY24563.1 MAG: hypothetical protein A2126_02065 [Candidatus Woykebacteria bacterium GWB1_45_5]